MKPFSRRPWSFPFPGIPENRRKKSVKGWQSSWRKMLKKGYSSDRVVAGKTYSTFVDNMSHSNSIDEQSATLSRKSSTASLQQQPRQLPATMSSSSFNPKSLPSAPSTSSFQRHYAKPPVVPTTTSPLHHRENFVAGTGSYSRSFFLGRKCPDRPRKTETLVAF